MNEVPGPKSIADVKEYLRAILFPPGVMVLVLSFLNICVALSMRGLGNIIKVMINRHPLPAITEWVLGCGGLLALFSFAAPVVTVVILLAPPRKRSFYITGVLMLVSFVQLLVVVLALSAPLFDMFENIQAVG